MTRVGIVLLTFRIVADELLQHVSRVDSRGTPLYYGRDGTNRYDDPARNYGVLYLGCDLPTALMESVFHKHQWDRDSKRSIALSEVHSRLVRAVGVLADLHLADLTAEGVMAGYFGLNLEQLASRGYKDTQKVSGQLHAMRDDDGVPLFDGVRYPSRNNYPASSIALFERSEKKVAVVEDIDLPDHAEWPRFVADYRIGVECDPGSPGESLHCNKRMDMTADSPRVRKSEAPSAEWRFVKFGLQFVFGQIVDLFAIIRRITPTAHPYGL